MMRLLLYLPLFLAIVLVFAWAGVLILSKDPGSLLAGGHADLVRAYPEEPRRLELLENSSLLYGRLAHSLSRHGAEASPSIRAGLRITLLHLAAALQVLPISMVLALAGACAGLAFRERIRDDGGYASPTAAGLARAVVWAGLIWLGLFALSPIEVAYGSLYLASLALSLGGFFYVANLPLKL